MTPNFHAFKPDEKEPAHCQICWQYNTYFLHILIPRPIPTWMTEAQAEAVSKLYQRDPDGSDSPEEFFKRVREYGGGSDIYVGLKWCGMFVGIEKDGYTHT